MTVCLLLSLALPLVSTQATGTGPDSEAASVMATLSQEPPQPPRYMNLGRFSYSLIGGVQFSQDDGEFSEENLFLQFRGDSSWRRNGLWALGGRSELEPGKSGDHRGLDWGDVHSSFELALDSVSAMTDTRGDDFLSSKKALSLTLALESRAYKLPWELGRWSPSTSGDMSIVEVMYIGPILKGGFHTLTESVDVGEDIDTVSSFASFGFRVGSFQQREGEFNPPLLRHVDITYGWHENYDDTRLVIDALLKTDPKTGFFVAAQAVLGNGEDDVRIMVGLDLNLRGLQQTVGGLANILPGGAQ